MLIHCPECHFDRHINEDKIPPAAEHVTCPQCKHRFRFRSLPAQSEAVESTPNKTLTTPVSVANDIEDNTQQTHEMTAQIDNTEADNNEISSTEISQEPEDLPEGLPKDLENAAPDDDPLPPGAQIFTDQPKNTHPKASPQTSTKSSQEGETSSVTSPKGNTGNHRNETTNPQKTEQSDMSLQGLLDKIHDAFTQPSPSDQAKSDARPATKPTKPTKATNNDNNSASNDDNLNDADDMYNAPVVPWESPEHYGFVQSFLQTILQVIFTPAAFFSNLRYASSSLTRPLLFFIILGMFQTLAEFLWASIIIDLIGSMVTDAQSQNMLNVFRTYLDNKSLPLLLLETSFFLAIELAIFTGIAYLMIRLVQPERAHLPIIVRIICYSIAPTVISIVPFFGPAVSSVWFYVACFIGCKHALDLTWQKTFMALGPLYFVAIIISLQVAQQIVAP